MPVGTGGSAGGERPRRVMEVFSSVDGGMPRGLASEAAS